MQKTFDPNAFARSTDKLQVEMVHRVSDRKSFEAASWIQEQTLGQIHALRPRLREGSTNEKIVCHYCGHDVILRQHTTGGHYFAHRVKTPEEKSVCIYQQDGIISEEERNRIRYHGQREGPRHIRTKLLIERILKADASFSEPTVEKVWRSHFDGWRKPDVSSKRLGIPYAFEAQISNTYPMIVAERTTFYRKQGAILFWIFDRHPEGEWLNLHADTFCTNNQHLFVVDETCAEISEIKGEAHFFVYSLRPIVEAFRRPEDQRFLLRKNQEKIYKSIPLSTLNINIKNQTASLFNVSEENSRVSHKILCAEAQAGANYDALEEDLKRLLPQTKPILRKNVEGWAALVCAIESQITGHPVGTKLDEKNVAGVPNIVYDHHPAFFLHLTDTLERLNLKSRLQNNTTWRSRVNNFQNGIYKNESVPEPHPRAGKLLEWLYP
jgi:hypothetical protein